MKRKEREKRDYFEIYRITKNHLWARRIEDIKDLILTPKDCGLKWDNFKGGKNDKY